MAGRRRLVALDEGEASSVLAPGTDDGRNQEPSSKLALTGSASWGTFDEIEFGGLSFVYRTLEDSSSDATEPAISFSGRAAELGTLSVGHPIPRDEAPDHTVEVADPILRGGYPYVSLVVLNTAIEQLNPEAYADYLASEGLDDLPGETTEFYAESGTITSQLDSIGDVVMSFDVVMQPVPGQMGPELRLVGTGRGPLSIKCGYRVGEVLTLDVDGGWIFTPQWEFDPTLESAYCQTFADWVR